MTLEDENQVKPLPNIQVPLESFVNNIDESNQHVALENTHLFQKYRGIRKQLLVIAYIFHVFFILFLVIYFFPTILSLCFTSYPQMSLKGPFTDASFTQRAENYREHRILFSQTQYNGENYVSSTSLQFALNGNNEYYRVEYYNVITGIASILIDPLSYCVSFSVDPNNEQIDCSYTNLISWALVETIDDPSIFYITFSPLSNETIEVNTNLDVVVTYDGGVYQFSSPLIFLLYSIVGIVISLACFSVSVVMLAIAMDYKKKMLQIIPFKVEIPSSNIDPR